MVVSSGYLELATDPAARGKRRERRNAAILIGSGVTTHAEAVLGGSPEEAAAGVDIPAPVVPVAQSCAGCKLTPGTLTPCCLCHRFWHASCCKQKRWHGPSTNVAFVCKGCANDARCSTGVELDSRAAAAAHLVYALALRDKVLAEHAKYEAPLRAACLLAKLRKDPAELARIQGCLVLSKRFHRARSLVGDELVLACVDLAGSEVGERSGRVEYASKIEALLASTGGHAELLEALAGGEQPSCVCVCGGGGGCGGGGASKL